MKNLVDFIEVALFLYFSAKIIRAILGKGKKRRAGIVGKIFYLFSNCIHHRINMLMLKQKKYFERQYLAQKKLLEEKAKVEAEAGENVIQLNVQRS